MKRYVFTIILLFGSLFLKAQMTLDECVSYAVKNSYKINVQKTRTEDEKIAYNQAIMNFLPSISGSTAVEANFGRGIDPETNSYINETSLANSMNISGDMPVFNGFKLINTARKAKISLLRGENELQRLKDEIALETMAAYAQVVYYRELLDLYEQKIQMYLLEQEKMEKKLELGIGSRADLAQIQARVSKEKFSAISATNNYELSLIRLKDCMNFPLNDELMIVGIIEESILVDPNQRVDDLVAEAVSANPGLLSFSKGVEIEKLNLKIAKGGYYPRINLYGGIATTFFRHLNSSTYTSYSSQLSNNLGQWVGFSLNIPLFDRNYRRNSIRLAKSTLKRAQLDYDNNARVLESEIRQAVMELNAAESAFIEAKHSVEYQELATLAIRKKYEKGVSSIIEVQTSDADLFSTEVELRNSYLKYQLKLREINYYKGLPLYIE